MPFLALCGLVLLAMFCVVEVVARRRGMDGGQLLKAVGGLLDQLRRR